MRYVDPNTRKRPMWEDFKEVYRVKDGCKCLTRIIGEGDLFRHWNNGHFDEYEEYKHGNEIKKVQKGDEKNG